MKDGGSLADSANRQEHCETLDTLRDVVRNELSCIVASLQSIDSALSHASDIAWQHGPLRAHTHISQAQGVLAALYSTVEAMEPYTDWM